MPRQARMHEVGDVHHVMSHGIDSLNLFETEQDCTTIQNSLLGGGTFFVMAIALSGSLFFHFFMAGDAYENEQDDSAMD
jgi:hypothetical protein